LAVKVSRRALVRHGRVIFLGAIEFSLDEASQGGLGVRLVMGPDALRRCLLFGGSVQRDTRGSFIAVKSPPPAACP
jgi:hypothetical protein